MKVGKKAMKMIVEYLDADGEVQEGELPCKMEVCPTCEGHGTHLTPSMRDHAYSAEEFAESFDDEEAAEYFQRGGRYDVVCEECHGKNVVKVVDEDSCKSEEQKAILAGHHKHLEEEWAFRAECAAERRMGC